KNSEEEINVTYFLNYDDNGNVKSITTIDGRIIDAPREKIKTEGMYQLLQAFNDEDELIFEFDITREVKVVDNKNIKLVGDLDYTLELNDDGLPIKFTLEGTLVETFEYFNMK
ncbi:hypothetical protein V6O07_19930, partial [Arthrospira platensis SPKY2]